VFFLKNEKRFMIKSSTSHEVSFMDAPAKAGLIKVFAPITVTLKKETLGYFLRYSADSGQDSYMYASLSPKEYLLYRLQHALKRLSRLNVLKHLYYRSTSVSTPVNLTSSNFLRKERLYTKLKYSRSPAYDIVSGGSAALLAGFLGFLISEKFGFELVDSGDFYYGFMYIVFIAFSVKPLSLVASNTKGFLSTLSL
jgi:hypothetical protein